jgi:hypothetical protein
LWGASQTLDLGERGTPYWRKGYAFEFFHRIRTVRTQQE